MDDKKRQKMLKEIEKEQQASEIRSKFAEENRVKFGKYYTAWGVPCIELINPDGKMAYLSAFRRYAFQVSGTRDGQWSRGETPVFGLETLDTIRQVGASNLSQNSTQLYIIGAVAMDAINNYCYRENYFPPAEYYSFIRDDKEEWNKFIENSRRFLQHRDDVEIVNDEHIKPKKEEEEKVLETV